MVEVAEQVSIGQKRGGSWHGQGRLVVSHLLGQYNTQTINYWLTIQILSSVNNSAMETIPRLHGREIPL